MRLEPCVELIVHFDLIGQKSHQKTNSKLEECQLNLFEWFNSELVSESSFALKKTLKRVQGDHSTNERNSP